jgi:DHA1 family tetracycline resistance protein-like MFS transporter
MHAAPRKAALAFIFVTVVLDVLSIGIIIPVLPKLIEQFSGGDTAQAARAIGVFGMAWAFMQFFCSPILGALSDRYGRRAVILLSCFGLGLDYLLMALAPTLAWLFVGRLLSGMFGASFATAHAYIADVTPVEKRAGAFGIMGAAWGLGFVLGPALGGLLGEHSPRLPFWVAAALSLVNALYGFFVLPESLPPDQREAFSWRRANPLGALRLLRSHRELSGLAAVNALYWTAYHALPSVFVLYVGLRYGWSAQTVGLALAAVGVANVIVQGVLVRRIVARIGERRALLLGALAGAVGYLLYAFAPTPALFVLAIPVFAFIGLFTPSLLALMSRRVSPSEQGQLQGANGSISAITGLYGPGLFAFTFAYFITPQHGLQLPGAPFLLAGLILFAAAALAWRATRPEAGAAPASASTAAGKPG